LKKKRRKLQLRSNPIESKESTWSIKKSFKLDIKIKSIKKKSKNQKLNRMMTRIPRMRFLKEPTKYGDLSQI
jgi:hypothetical protein